MSNSADPIASRQALARALAGAGTRREAAIVAERWLAESADAIRHTGPPDPPRRRAGAAHTTGRIGIWVSQRVDGETWFVRDPAFDDTDTLWADLERIGPKRHRKRIVFLGESCARGFPYDPLFNCVDALRTYLGSIAGSGDIEIVDLARCAITPGPLVDLIEASRALDPDVYVLFAGNNWQVHPQRLDFDHLVTSLSTAKSWRAIAPELERPLRTQVADWMTALASACRRVQTPALFVIPAQNQRDGWLPARRYNPLLTSQEQTRREDLIARMHACESAGDEERAGAIAGELIELEEGFSIAGLQGLARRALARGALEEATRLFEQAREMLVYLPLAALDSYAMRVDEMRAAAAREALPIVDLRCCFREAGQGLPPGRDFFLDRVHMTARGIRVAMAATASALLPLLDLPTTPWRDLLATHIDVEPRAEAQAHLFYAHYMMPHAPQLAREHCQDAVASTREIADVMWHYADLLMRRVPFVFCDAFHRLHDFEPRFPGLRGLARRALDNQDRYVTADITLARFLLEPIEAEHPGAIAHYEALVRQQHAVGSREIDLLPCSAEDEAIDGVPAPRRVYMKCFRRETPFVVIGPAAPAAVRIRLTARGGRPGAAEQTASLALNGSPVHTWRLSHAWQTIECTVPAASVRDGINRLTIAWPDPCEPAGERLRLAVAAFADQRTLGSPQSPDVFTVYGEIAVLTAC